MLASTGELKKARYIYIVSLPMALNSPPKIKIWVVSGVARVDKFSGNSGSDALAFQFKGCIIRA